MVDRRKIAARVILVAGLAAIGVAAAFAWQAPTEPVRKIAGTHVTTRELAATTARPVPPKPASSPSAPAPLVVRRVLDMGGPIEFGAYLWDDKDVPAGPLVITVDVAAQTLSVFRNGYEIGATAILYGADAKPTPLGTFPITQKDAHHFSRTYGNAPMPYALRLTGDGVFIHGSKVEWGYATHGCIGVPVAFAQKLFGVASIGDRVIITKGKFIGVGQAIAS